MSKDPCSCRVVGRNYDFVFAHKVLTHGESDKVIFTEIEYTKKILIIQTLDGKDEVHILWWSFFFHSCLKIKSSIVAIKVGFEEKSFLYKLWWKNDGVQDDKHCGKSISGCSRDEENDERVFFVKNWDVN